MRKSKKRDKKTALSYVVVISALIMLYCAGRLFVYTVQNAEGEARNRALRDKKKTSALIPLSGEEGIIPSGSVSASAYDDTGEDNGELRVLEQYKELYDMNNDMVGWVTIDGTEIDYPVMQTVYDEEYYIKRDFYKKDFSGGVPFLDCRCKLDERTTNVLIYGHNMKNGSMFHDLLKYEDSDFYRDHRYIHFDTIYEQGLYEIVAVFRTRVAYQDEDTFRFYNFIEADSGLDYTRYLINIRNLSLYDIEAEASDSDELITLTTCEYSVEDGRFVVVAKRVS